jgi:hypothetical protein
MWTFLAAGSLYLLGVAVVLVLKPRWMFTPEGDWKEFGIGKREDRYTPFPFWLFCLVWALVAYTLVVFLEPVLLGERNSYEESSNADEETFELPVRSNLNTGRRNGRNGRANNKAATAATAPTELPKGYYVLDRKATSLSGVPKYVYLGAEEPSGGIDSTARSLDAE